MFSGEQSFWTRARQPFLAASSRAASPLSRSWMSVSPSFTMSSGMLPSRFFLVGSAPCWTEKFKGVLFYKEINICYTWTFVILQAKLNNCPFRIILTITNMYDSGGALLWAAVCRFHIFPWLQPHEVGWTSKGRPRSPKPRVWPAAQPLHNAHRNRHCGGEQDHWGRKTRSENHHMRVRRMCSKFTSYKTKDASTLIIMFYF